tara:strand:+ start:59 stop:859 length:801 start_codon:yes stop_codon:yes gene_type:complete
MLKSPVEDEVYLTAADWKWHRLSSIGKMTYVCGCMRYGHLGIFFRGLRPEELEQLRTHRRRVWREKAAWEALDSLKPVTSVTWDYQYSKRVKFQRFDNDYYEGSRAYHLYRVTLSTEERTELFQKCLEMTLMGPINKIVYRLDGFFNCCPVAPHTCCVDGSGVAASTCQALTLRAIAAAVAEVDANYWGKDPIRSDRAAFEALEIPQGWCWTDQRLVQLSPWDTLTALQKIGRVSESYIDASEGDAYEDPFRSVWQKQLPTLSMLR